MFTKLREQFGSAGLVLSVVAIVLALGGGAYAANHATVSKAKAGPRGKTGKTGPAGPAGPVGPAGLAGTNGANGANGVSATTESFSGKQTFGSVTCEEGGAVVKSASPEVPVCNGKKGTTGFTETLPPKRTETGTWAFAGRGTSIGGNVNLQKVSISFPIPLSAALDESHVQFVEKETPATGGCGAGIPEEGEMYPEADPGYLCVYATHLGEATLGYAPGGAPLFQDPERQTYGSPGAGRVGTLLNFTVTSSKEVSQAQGDGVWAVTAPVTAP